MKDYEVLFIISFLYLNEPSTWHQTLSGSHLYCVKQSKNDDNLNEDGGTQSWKKHHQLYRKQCAILNTPLPKTKTDYESNKVNMCWRDQKTIFKAAKRRMDYKVLVHVFKAIHAEAPEYLCNVLTVYQQTCYLRSASCVSLVVLRNKAVTCDDRYFGIAAVTLWNS